MSDTNPVEARLEWEKKDLEAKLEKVKEALVKIESLDDKGWVALSHYDRGLEAAHRATGSIARKALNLKEEDS